MLVGLERMQKLVELSLTTGVVRNDKSVSLCLIADPALGKSDLIISYRNYPGVLYFSYTSIYQLLHDYLGDLEAGRYHHILIPDFSQVVFKPREIASSELAGINSLIEEGLGAITTRTAKFTPKQPLHIGIITACTHEDFIRLEDRAPSGFLSRLVWMTYDYGEKTLAKIRKVLMEGQNPSTPSTPYMYTPAPKTSISIKGSEELLERLWEAGVVQEARLPGDTRGLRTFRILCQLCRAHALLNRRYTIQFEDVHAVADLARLFGTKLNSRKEL